MPLRHYRRIFDDCEPYLIARRAIVDRLDTRPLDIAIPPANIFDPQRLGNETFLRLVQHVNALTYGPIGLPMPDWVFYDCAVMPGAIFGFARRAADVEPWFRRSLGVPDGYAGLVPVSIYICIPTVRRDAALVYTLCSVNQVAVGAAPEGLWRLTLALGIKAFHLHHMMAVSQWRSPQLGLYAGLGPLELITAWTPAHDNPASCTFKVDTSDTAVERLLRGDVTGPEGIDAYVDADDFAALKRVQAAVESGRRIAIAGPAEIRGASTRVPLQIRDDDAPFELGSSVGYTRRFQG